MTSTASTKIPGKSQIMLMTMMKMIRQIIKRAEARFLICMTSPRLRRRTILKPLQLTSTAMLNSKKIKSKLIHLYLTTNRLLQEFKSSPP